MTITEFLLARITEDEAAARIGDDNRIPIDCWDPDRVLAECKAKRRIVELHSCDPGQGSVWDPACTVEGYGVTTPDNCDTLRALASVYADHSDFDPAWQTR